MKLMTEAACRGFSRLLPILRCFVNVKQRLNIHKPAQYCVDLDGYNITTVNKQL